ncbi:MAG TPA: glycosyltransferase, partial [Waddliaceae bacterium]
METEKEQNMKIAPIVLFVYNRLETVKKTIESLQMNTLAKESELYIFSDGPKNPDDKIQVDLVREYLKTIRGFKNITIDESPKNSGLAISIIHGVTEIVEKFNKVIVLEDDLITSPYFLQFM